MKKLVLGIGTSCLLFGLVTFAQAELKTIGTAEYDSDGNGITETYKLIWDDDNNGNSIIWLDYSNPETTWEEQNSWANSLADELSISFDTGYEALWQDDNWRLSYMIDGSMIDYGCDGSNTNGYNITSSELGHLFFTELGNLSYYDMLCNQQSGGGLTNSGDFENLLGSWYWSSIDYSIQPVHAWYASLLGGYQGVNPKSWEMYGLAVRSAEVSFNPNQTTGPVIEAGVVIASYSTWTDVELVSEYESMVVVCTPAYTKKAPPTVIRIQNAIGNSFQILAQNVDGQVGAYNDINAHCIAIEEGVYNLADDGVKLEAIKIDSSIVDRARRWKGQELVAQNQYENPVVLGQVMTYYDDHFSTFWSRGITKKDPPSTSSIFVGKHIGEDTVRDRNTETLGVIIIESGQGTISGINYVAATGPDTAIGIANKKAPVTYQAQTPIEGQISILSMAGMDGGNGGWPVLYGDDAVISNTIGVAVDEDQIKDVERSHTTEQLSYILFE